jgi:hypothetical protein
MENSVSILREVRSRGTPDVLSKLSFALLDPGEVAICFGDEGTWCPLYQHDSNGEVHQTYSDGEETGSSLVSDDELTHNMKALTIDNPHLSSDNFATDCLPNATSTTMNTQIHLMHDWRVQ